VADSTGQCNTFAEHLSGRVETESLAWPLVQLSRDRVELKLRIARDVDALRRVLPEQPIGIFVASALPEALRIAEVGLRHICWRQLSRVLVPMDRTNGLDDQIPHRLLCNFSRLLRDNLCCVAHLRRIRVHQAQPVDGPLRLALAQLFQYQPHPWIGVHDDAYAKPPVLNAMYAVFDRPIRCKLQWRWIVLEHATRDRFDSFDRRLVPANHDDGVMVFPLVDSANGVEVGEVDV